MLVVSIVLMCNGIASCLAQSGGQEFDLVMKDGHFYTTAVLNGTAVDMMIESGTPALIISCSLYDRMASEGLLKLQEDKAKMRFLTSVYDIKYSGDARLNLGNAIYDGPVFVLDGDIDPSVPIQYLQNGEDGSAIVEVDLPSNKIRVMDKSAFDASSYEAFPIRLNKTGNMPVVSAELAMMVESKKTTMQGDFIVDMGNGSLLFLMKQNKGVQDMLTGGEIQLKEARDKQGNVIAEGLYADSLAICGKSFFCVSVGVTDRLQGIEEAGFLGVKFMTMPIAFDFKEKKMYVKK